MGTYRIGPAGVLTLLSTLVVVTPLIAQSGDRSDVLSTRQRITPLASRGASFTALNPHLADNPEYTVGQAETSVVSPDGKTLLVLTSGFNRISDPSGQQNKADSTEWIFVFDITSGTATQKQAIAVPNTYSGIAFHPNGQEFYVSGGDDDDVHTYRLRDGSWKEAGSPVALGHLAKAAPDKDSNGGLGLLVKPEAAGLALTNDGKTMVVVNYENDSISTLTADGTGWKLDAELDLRPGVVDPTTAKGRAGGEYPFWVSIKGRETAYVSSIRDRRNRARRGQYAGTPDRGQRLRGRACNREDRPQPVQEQHSDLCH